MASMKIVIMAIAAAGMLQIAAQTSETASTPAAKSTQTSSTTQDQTDQDSAVIGDRFPALRETADRLRAELERIQETSKKEIDQLKRTGRCEDKRVTGDVDRTIDALKQWADAEKRYWESWNEVESVRVASEEKVRAGLVEDQQRILDEIDGEKKVQETLQRQRTALEDSPRTAEIRARMDELEKDIRDSKAKFEALQQDYEGLTRKIASTNAIIGARLAEIHQNLSRIVLFAADRKGEYEAWRAEAEEVCNVIAPKSRTLPRNSGAKK